MMFPSLRRVLNSDVRSLIESCSLLMEGFTLDPNNIKAFVGSNYYRQLQDVALEVLKYQEDPYEFRTALYMNPDDVISEIDELGYFIINYIDNLDLSGYPEEIQTWKKKKLQGMRSSHSQFLKHFSDAIDSIEDANLFDRDGNPRKIKDIDALKGSDSSADLSALDSEEDFEKFEKDVAKLDKSGKGHSAYLTSLLIHLCEVMNELDVPWDVIPAGYSARAKEIQRSNPNYIPDPDKETMKSLTPRGETEGKVYKEGFEPIVGNLFYDTLCAKFAARMEEDAYFTEYDAINDRDITEYMQTYFDASQDDYLKLARQVITDIYARAFKTSFINSRG